jgi:ubiquinone/menaquinone biosynthesis C-methylase UbiE
MQKSFEEVKAFWQAAAAHEFDQEQLRPTARDPYLQQAIESVVCRYLPEKPAGTQLLDIGCGDGTSTFKFAPFFERAVGIDYADGFIARATSLAQREQVPNLRFHVGDATDLSPWRDQYGKFDVAVSIRCLINLATWENQKQGIEEAARSLKPGGLYILSEGWQEGMEGLNQARQAAGLEPMAIAPYNVLIRRSTFDAVASQYFTTAAYESLGVYMYLSRVVQPLLVAPEAPRHTHPLNRVAMEIVTGANRPGFDDCDYAGIIVLRRK